MERILPAVLCAVLILSSCSPMRYTTRRGNHEYSKETPIVIAPYHDHSSSGHVELVRQLQRKGFDVINVDGHRSAPHNPGYHRHGGHKPHGGPEMNDASCILEIKCIVQRGTINTYESFYATLIDNKTGRVILTAELKEPRRVRPTIRALVNKMDRLMQ